MQRVPVRSGCSKRFGHDRRRCHGRYSNRNAHAAVDGVLQILQQMGLGAGRLHAALEVAEHVTHGRGCIENRIHDFRRDFEFAIAQLVEQILRQVAERDQFGGMEKTRAALDGVKAAEDLVEQRTITRRPFEVDQLVVDTGQQVSRLDQEVLQQVVHPVEIAHAYYLR